MKPENPGCPAKGAQRDAGSGLATVHFSTKPKEDLKPLLSLGLRCASESQACTLQCKIIICCAPLFYPTICPEIGTPKLPEEAQFRGALLQSLKRQQCAFTEMQQLAEEPRELGSALYGVGTLGWCRKASNEAVAASLHLDTCCSWLYIANAISCADLVRQFPFGSYSVVKAL